MRRWASGIRGDGPEAQNFRKGNYIEETHVSSRVLFLWDIPLELGEDLPSFPEQ